jgi:hypothetical protein
VTRAPARLAARDAGAALGLGVGPGGLAGGLAARLAAGLAAGLAVSLTVAASASAAGVVTKVRDNGPDDNRVVLVVVAEGYLATQQARFDADAERAVAGYFAEPPLASYARLFNVYTDFVASDEEGADRPAPCYGAETLVDTAFDATYCSGGTRRLLTVRDRTALFAEVNEAVPTWDVIAVVVNDGEYGGSGGSVLVFSTNVQSVELFLHEAGHTFGRLADEYEGNPDVGTWAPEPNVTTDTDRDLVKWSPWIDAATPVPTPEVAPWTDGRVGSFEGARYHAQGIYRPVHDCKMRSLGRPFDAVCGEAHVQSIWNVVSPVDGRDPTEVAVAIDPCAARLELRVTPLQPDPPTVVARWLLDGEEIPGESGFTLALDPATLSGPSHEVIAVLRDDTPLVRRPFLTPMVGSAPWALTRDEPPGDLDGDGQDDGCDPDDDGDGVPDGDDCLPRDPVPPAPPPDVARLDVARDGAVALLSWTDVAGGDPAPDARHEVVSGRLLDLRRDRGFAAACRLAELPEALATDARGAPGDGLWYLVRARDACGDGGYGSSFGGGDARAELAAGERPDC